MESKNILGLQQLGTDAHTPGKRKKGLQSPKVGKGHQARQRLDLAYPPLLPTLSSRREASKRSETAHPGLRVPKELGG